MVKKVSSSDLSIVAVVWTFFSKQSASYGFSVHLCWFCCGFATFFYAFEINY